MHRDRFSDVRNFLRDRSRLILQDDSGVPVNWFDQASWQLRPFGHYSGPIALFASRHQPKLSQLFKQSDVEPIDFAIGYRISISRKPSAVSDYCPPPLFP
jgi:hypothetical protein